VRSGHAGGKENLLWGIKMRSGEGRAQEDGVRKEKGRNGGEDESNLGLQLICLFIAKIAVGAHNGPLISA
jgi:hypothetical protein